jgi:hypothetical protein
MLHPQFIPIGSSCRKTPDLLCFAHRAATCKRAAVGLGDALQKTPSFGAKEATFRDAALVAAQ